MQYLPCDILSPFIKNYVVVTIDKDINNEIFYPSGYIDFVVNFSNGNAATIISGKHQDTPEFELLGHLTVPARLNATKGTTVLIARMYPYACSIFFPNPISDFTNSATNVSDVYSKEMRDLYELTMYADSIDQKINLLESFFIQKLKKQEKQYRKIQQLSLICQHILTTGEGFNLKQLSSSTGLSKRYIQKQFFEMVGLTPGTFYASYRFNKSLQQVLSTNSSLTSIAYECGYYDQAHFIKEFNKFTGISPSQARGTLIKNGDDFQKAVNIGL
ncbi:AraC-type DNA-binding protein [Chitinophaga sp. YR573]|uniref:helix-turn-helix transcriptional regulator n=1 Tax=Chitinophaga sp. YR573 TaxID=1881040 RepID=UPI0008D3F597|nr:helix-turn-helix transcriptional regulator [Chitinophaga sp. YR573]SEW29154.1 AraC-type DNA-binding protein [Chitinophaga sp. YR573]